MNEEEEEEEDPLDLILSLTVCVCVFALYIADICYVCVLGHTGCGSIFAQVRHVGGVGWVEKQFNLPSLHLL